MQNLVNGRFLSTIVIIPAALLSSQTMDLRSAKILICIGRYYSSF